MAFQNKKPSTLNDADDSQDESLLLRRLRDKAKLLERLGGELPSELQQMIKDESNSTAASPKLGEDGAKAKTLDIDDLLEEIEKKEFAKAKPQAKDDCKDPKDSNSKSNLSSVANSPRSDGNRTPPLEELKVLFPAAKNVAEPVAALFPSAATSDEPAAKPPSPAKPEKKENIYLMNSAEPLENTNRKRLRISNSVLPERRTEAPAYTTRYAHSADGFIERTGLGFSAEEDAVASPKDTVSYGNGLTFTKGGTLNGEPPQPAQPVQTPQPVESAESGEMDEPETLESRLSQLCEMQPAVVPELQRMLIQLQVCLDCFY